ncbi:uncharacterized protein V3H82_006025 isoform 2-T2 [Fundulus diaphanus]
MEPKVAQMPTSSIESQKDTIGRLLKATLRKGDEWYLIDHQWFKRWKKYVGFDCWDMSTAGDHSVYPGPIDNSGLFSDQVTQALKEHLIDELDYVLVPTEAWNKLVSWYGCLEGQSPIVRKVIEHGMFVKHCKVEVYLLELSLCENNNMEKVIKQHFSRADTIETIEKKMRTLFSIPTKKETRLWSKYISNSYEQLTNPKRTVQDAGLFHEQLIGIEVKNEDGTWPGRDSHPKSSPTPPEKGTTQKLPSNPPVSSSPPFAISNSSDGPGYALNNSHPSSNRQKTIITSAKVQEDKQPKEVEANDKVLPEKQNNLFTPTAANLPPTKAEGAGQETLLLPVDHFWYMSHIYKEEIKRIERKNRIKIVAQVHVTFEAEQEDGRPDEALCEFTELSQSCSAESGDAVIPLKFVDPDQWSDALKVIKRSDDKLLLTMSSEEVIVCGPRKSQEEFSAVLNAMQKTQLPPASDDTSQRMINRTQKDPHVGTKLPTEETSRKLTTTSAEDVEIKPKCNLNVKYSNRKGKNTQYFKRYGFKSSLTPNPINKIAVTSTPQPTQPFDEAWLDGLLKNCSQDSPRKVYCKQPSLIPPTAQQKAEASSKMGASGDNVFGVMEGNQPDGTMTWNCRPSSLPGFSGCGHIVITYMIPNGKQTEKHPNPGRPYQGTKRTAYLPDNEEGQEVLNLLKKAFDQKMIFTVGTSRTTGLDNQVIWNDISHKTAMTGGPQNFGYPDPDYLSRVKEDLKTKSIERL